MTSPAPENLAKDPCTVLQQQLKEALRALEVERTKVTVARRLMDYEHAVILDALGVQAPRKWGFNEAIAKIKECVAGCRKSNAQKTPPLGITFAQSGVIREESVRAVVRLSPTDRELGRAWDRFPDAVAENEGYCWAYLATELIGDQWIHLFVHELHPDSQAEVQARVPACPGWKPGC